MISHRTSRYELHEDTITFLDTQSEGYVEAIYTSSETPWGYVVVYYKNGKLLEYKTMHVGLPNG